MGRSEDEDGLGESRVDGELDGFHQQTAMFDKGQFLGELADLVDGSPDTRAQVEAAPAPPRGCRFIVVAGPDLGSAWAFRESEVIIGRDEDCDLPLADIAVSRRHVRVSLEGSSFFVEDLDSNNGTLLNGDRVTARVHLVAGDELIVGERTLRFVELNEAPPTDDKVQVHADAEGEAAFEAGAGLSQIDLPAEDGASKSTGSEVRDPSVPRGRALRRMFTLGAAALLAIAVAGGSAYAWRRHLQMNFEAERAQATRTRFLQALALVRSERFGDAARVLDALAALDPEHPRLGDYRAHVRGELEQWDRLQGAASKAEAGAFPEALALLAQVGPESAYAKEAARRVSLYERRWTERQLRSARAALAEGALDRALARVAEALERAPGSTQARLLIDEIEGVRAGRRPTPPSKPKFSVPPILHRAVALYREGRLDAAIDAAEAAGTPDARVTSERLRTLDRALAEASRAHRKKAAAALLEIASRALEIDAQVGGGEGVIHDRLITYFADGLYLRGIEALAAGEVSRARRFFSSALGKKPSHRLAQDRLAELEERARTLYYEAQVLEAKDPAAARAAFQRLVDTTPPSDRYHRLARKRLLGR